MPVDLYANRADRRLRKLAPGSGPALCGDEDQRPGLRPVHVFRDDPRSGYEPLQDLDAAVARADFITSTARKTPETVGMFDAARIGKMKRSAFLVNTARGALSTRRRYTTRVKEPHRRRALDVFVEEPTPNDNRC